MLCTVEGREKKHRAHGDGEGDGPSAIASIIPKAAVCRDSLSQLSRLEVDVVSSDHHIDQSYTN